MADLATDTVDTGTEVVVLDTTSQEGAVVKPEGSNTETGVDKPDANEPPEDQTPEWAVKRFAKLTAQREEEKRLRESAEVEREAYKKLLFERGQKPEEIKPEPKAVQLVAPKADDFDNYDAYIDACVDYKVQVTLQKRDATASVQTEAQNLQTKFVQSVEKFKEKTPDYDAAVSNPAFVQSPALIEAVLYSEMGPQIAYYLAKNVAETNRLNRLNPVAVAREIGRLEERLTPSQPKKVTDAPAPIKAVGGNGTDKVSKDPKDMTMDEYADYRKSTTAWKGRKR